VNVRFESVALAELVIPEGRLDFAAAAGFQRQLEDRLADTSPAPEALIVDCSALDYVSSAGLRVFLLAARAAQRAGIPFALCALKPPVRDVFELSGFSRIISVRADRAAALAHAAAGASTGSAMKEQRVVVPSDAEQLGALTQFLRQFWADASLPPAQALAFELALEEVFMNVVRHGSPDGTTPRVEVSLSLRDSGLVMTIEDDGPPFDPLTVPPPDVTASLGARPVGGLGVFLVRQMMDAVSYQRVGSRNQLRLTKEIAPASVDRSPG
jgi:serine/threonine-protein kinase RsbW